MLVAVYTIVSLLTRLIALRADILNVDEASYLVGAWELLRGRMAYLDFGDNKPPLIYVYYAVAQLLAGRGITSVRLITTLATVPATAFAVSAFYRHDRRGIAAALAFLIYSASYDADDMLAVNCEIVMLLPLAWAAVMMRDADAVVRRRSLFAAGAFIGIATLVKYQAAFWTPAIAIAFGAANWSRSRRDAALGVATLCAGVAVPIVLTFGAFEAVGGREAFVYWNVTHNIGYLRNPIGMADAVSLGAKRWLPFGAVTSVLWFGWARSSAMPQISRYHKHLVAALVAASAAAAFLGLRFFAHYFVQLYVPLAIGAGPWLATVLVWPIGAAGWFVAGSAIATVAAFTAANTIREPGSSPAINRVSHHVAARLRSDACYAGASMFVWGSAPTFYYHAELPVASRFMFPESPLVPYFAGNPAATVSRKKRHHTRDKRLRQWRWLMADLRRAQPTYILDTAPARLSRWDLFPLRDFPMLERFVRRRYTALTDVDGVTIYRRRDCAGSLLAYDATPDR